MKKQLLGWCGLGWMAVVGASSATAHACSIHINQVAMKNDLTARALTHLGITISSVTSGDVLNYAQNIVETDPSTLCPTELTFAGDVQVAYRRSALQVCQGTLHVVKTENWLNEPTPGVDPESYVVTGDRSITCRLLRPLPRPF